MEVEIVITGTFVKQAASDTFVSVDATGEATYANQQGTYTVQGTNFSIEEHPIHAPK